MCGRYAIIQEKELLKRYDKPVVGGYALNPRYNVAPTQNAPVITRDGIEVMRWGLLPHWAKDLSIGFKMINAKAETILEKPAFRGLVKARRCLVPASGFYEWLKHPDGTKQPYYIFVKDQELISFAGLWTERQDAEGHPLKSYTIITTGPNELVARIHDRMPVILSKDEEDAWLSEAVSAEEAAAMLDPFPAELMDMYAVDMRVGSTRNDDPGLIDRLPGQD